jgi:hypothetical protein
MRSRVLRSLLRVVVHAAFTVQLVACIPAKSAEQPHIESTVDVIATMRVRLSTRDVDAAACASGCYDREGQLVGECLARCSGRMLDSGTCTVTTDEVCAMRQLRWTETRLGSCKEVQTVGERILSCREKSVGEAPPSGGRILLGVVAGVVLLGVLALDAACRNSVGCRE